MPTKICPSCKNETLRHLHYGAHGMPGTHIDGSEWFECDCGFECTNYKEGKELGIEFIFDNPDRFLVNRLKSHTI